MRDRDNLDFEKNNSMRNRIAAYQDNNLKNNN